MLKRKGGRAGFKLAAVALANKLARIVFAVLRSGEVYDDRAVAARAKRPRQEISLQGEKALRVIRG